MKKGSFTMIAKLPFRFSVCPSAYKIFSFDYPRIGEMPVL
jgi:hypothetical protein